MNLQKSADPLPSEPRVTGSTPVECSFPKLHNTRGLLRFSFAALFARPRPKLATVEHSGDEAHQGLHEHLHGLPPGFGATFGREPRIAGVAAVDDAPFAKGPNRIQSLNGDEDRPDDH
jgi:hypothetical protein